MFLLLLIIAQEGPLKDPTNVYHAENYTKLEEIESLYEDAKARHEQAIESARIEAERVEAEKKAHAAKIRAEKSAKK